MSKLKKLKKIKKIIKPFYKGLQYIKNKFNSYNYIMEYLTIIDINRTVAYKYLRTHHKIIKFKYGNDFFNECYLNYIIIYHPYNIKNFQRIKDIILIKKKYHKSDLAIISNYIDSNISKEQEDILIKHLIRISNSLGLYLKNVSNNVYIRHQVKQFFKKKLKGKI